MEATDAGADADAARGEIEEPLAFDAALPPGVAAGVGLCRVSLGRVSMSGIEVVQAS